MKAPTAAASTLLAFIAVAHPSGAGERAASIRVRVRASERAVSGTGDSVRDVQVLLPGAKGPPRLVEALPDETPDLELVVSHRFAIPEPDSTAPNGRLVYTLSALVIDGRRPSPLRGEGIVWRQAAVDLVRTLAEYARLEEHALLFRRPDWPAIGFDFEPLTKQRQKQIGVKGGAVLVMRATTDEKAPREGPLPGDVLVKVGDRKLETAGELARAIYEAAPGSTLRIEALRAGARLTFTLVRP
jgi:hypothetical protein